MDVETIYKGVLTASALLGIGSVVYAHLLGKWGRMKEDYKFAKDFLADLNSDKEMHPYQRAKGYQALAGDPKISADEGDFLLSLHSCEEALRYYVLARDYLEHVPDPDHQRIQFKANYKSKFSRQWRKALYYAGYVRWAVLAMLPLILGVAAFKSLGLWLATYLVCGAIFLLMGVLSLRAGLKIGVAETLVRTQRSRYLPKNGTA